MSEKIEKLGRSLADNAPKVGIGAAVVVLLGVGYYYYTDMNTPSQPVPAPPLQQLNSRLSDDNADFQIVAGTILESNPVITETPNAQLRQMNMFDLRSVEAQRDRDRQFEAQVARAQQAFAAGNLEEAEELVDDILEQNPLHHRATDLKNQIVRAQQPEPAEPVEEVPLMGDPTLGGAEGQIPPM